MLLSAIRLLGFLLPSYATVLPTGSSTVDVHRIVRRMRGCSQSRLVEASDGSFYVAKFVGNPQGTRILVNEWITARAYAIVGICTPQMRLLHLPADVCSQASDLSFEGLRNRIEPGIHLGSQCPVNPETTAIFDFLPRKLLEKTSNVSDFPKALIVDILLGNSDGRQAVFTWDRSVSARASLKAYFIDHGGSLGGVDWEIHDRPWIGYYHDRAVYQGWPASVWHQGLEQIRAISSDVLFDAARELPVSWFGEGDFNKLSKVLLSTAERQALLSNLLKSRMSAAGLSMSAAEPILPDLVPGALVPRLSCA